MNSDSKDKTDKTSPTTFRIAYASDNHNLTKAEFDRYCALTDYFAYNRTGRRLFTVSPPAEVEFRIAFASDNHNLTKAEFERCCALTDYYTEEGKEIISYCSARGRDPNLFDRGNVWQGEWVDGFVKMLSSKKYNNVNRMRLFAWQFSAYRVADLTSVTLDWPPTKWFQDLYSFIIKELPDDDYIDGFIKEAVNPWKKINEMTPALGRIIDGIDNKYLHSQPLYFGEVAGEYRGFMVNGDSLRYWGISAVLYRSKIFEYLERRIAEKGFCRVMEIGAGYGGLAYQLKKTFGKKLQFIAVDLVESLIFSSCYLTTTLPDEKPLFYKEEKAIGPESGLVFVPTFRSPEFFDAITDVDLCVNTISMNEMTPAQVDYYGQKISKVLAPEGVFYECNWPAGYGPDRIEVKAYLEPHFGHRLSIEKSEAAADGKLDLWFNALPPAIEAACKSEYPSLKNIEASTALNEQLQNPLAANFWHSQSGWPQWLTFEFEQPIIRNSMRVHHVVKDGTTHLLEFEIAAADRPDNGWIMLHKGEMKPDKLEQIVRFENHKPYRYYRLTGLSNPKGTAHMVLSDVVWSYDATAAKLEEERATPALAERKKEGAV